MPAGVPSDYAAVVQINGANPAAGSEISDTVPANTYWRLVAVSVSLVQGITNTPQPILQLDDGTDVIFEMFGSSAAQAVSTTCRYTWAPGAPLSGQVGATTNVHSTAPLPDGLLLGPGYRIRTTTLGLAATGDYGAPSYLVVQYGG
jgi:hypothetical protein